MATYKKSEVTKDKIIQTAAKLFKEKGYGCTTIREICAASGVSQSRVNYHFSGKKELASEILRLTLLELDHAIEQVIPLPERGENLAAALYIRLWLGAFLSEAKYVRFCADLAGVGVFSQPMYEVFLRLLKTVEKSERPLSASEQQTAGYIYVAALSAFIQSKYEGKWSGTNDAFCDLFVELFFKLLYLPRAQVETLLVDSLRKKQELAAAKGRI